VILLMEREGRSMKRMFAAVAAAAGLSGCAYWGLRTSYELGRAIEAPVGAPLISVTQGDPRSPLLEQQLVYSGMSGKTIRLSYREFVHDLARPAFTQELQYDLADSAEIGFRNLRATVVKATNTMIVAIVTDDGGLSARAAADAAWPHAPVPSDTTRAGAMRAP
jgi:hypothetical protein